MENTFMHEVAITAILVNKDKFLITRRTLTKKRFPGKWTVPGGRLETTDYNSFPKDTESHWFNILERALKREVKEEVGLDVSNIDYVTSIASIHPYGTPSLIISCTADYMAGEVTLQESETDKFEWVTLEEAKNYDLIDGIYDQLVMVQSLKSGVRTEWKRFS